MSLRKSCSESVEISRASATGSSFSGLVDDGDDLDLQLLERLVELVDLPRVEVELVERERDLVLGHRPGGLRRLEQVPGFLASRGRPSPGPAARSTPGAHVLPLRDLLVTQRTCFRRCRTMPAAADVAP